MKTNYYISRSVFNRTTGKCISLPSELHPCYEYQVGTEDGAPITLLIARLGPYNQKDWAAFDRATGAYITSGESTRSNMVEVAGAVIKRRTFEDLEKSRKRWCEWYELEHGTKPKTNEVMKWELDKMFV